MIKLGVTGGLASGKSTACSYFKEFGARVFDADRVAKRLIFDNKEIQQKINSEFGVVVEGREDKDKLAQVAFSSEKKQQKLNKIVHPKVKEKFIQKTEELNQKGIELFVADVALLFESHFDKLVDYSLLIYADKHIRFERAQARGGINGRQIERRMKLQMDEGLKKQQASFVIENNGSKEDLYKKVEGIYKSLVN